MTTIVTETNRYASLCLKEKFDKWDKVTADELHAYFGFMVLMGMVSLPSSTKIKFLYCFDKKFIIMLIMLFIENKSMNTVTLELTYRRFPRCPP